MNLAIEFLASFLIFNRPFNKRKYVKNRIEFEGHALLKDTLDSHFIRNTVS